MLAILGPTVATVASEESRLILLATWVSVICIWLVILGVGAVILVMRLFATLTRKVDKPTSLVRELHDMRQKQSRHEYKQEQLLARIDTQAATLIGDLDALASADDSSGAARVEWTGNDGKGPKILFITSNGSGMGHLSRCLAIASQVERGGYRTAILTLSTAYRVVREAGYPVMYHPSSAATPWSIAVWNRIFARNLHRIVKSDRPDVIVFDGTAVYKGISQVSRRLEIPLVWLRRGLWKEGVSREQYDNPFRFADHVVVPGEVHGPLTSNQTGVNYVGPVSQANQLSILNSADAKIALGLDPVRRYLLVQVGTAKLGDRSAVEAALEAIKECKITLEPVVLVSPIAANDAVVQEVTVIHSRYPLAPYLKAFDLAICSAGYNSVHENLGVGLPAIYIPNSSTVTDNQEARARMVEEYGMGKVAMNMQELKSALEEVQHREPASFGVTEADNQPVADGADAVAEILRSVVENTK
ncbi:glycosyltransferase [Brevibacterium sp. LE-L]|uniref:glycosyltransferase n=1 Tax=Brevibacterium sp. LE-L TaxID=3418557 RepID=UPI003CF032FC